MRLHRLILGILVLAGCLVLPCRGLDPGATRVAHAQSTGGSMGGGSFGVWSPAAEDDRLSSAEFEVLYPDMKKIRGSSLAGRIHCTYCGGPFPAELLSCPHCGARVPEQAAS